MKTKRFAHFEIEAQSNIFTKQSYLSIDDKIYPTAEIYLYIKKI